MTVKELKEILEKMDENAEVILPDSEFGDHYLERVEIEDGDVYLR